MCTLILVLWGHALPDGAYQACFYDCGSRRRDTYDMAFKIPPYALCPQILRFA